MYDVLHGSCLAQFRSGGGAKLLGKAGASGHLRPWAAAARHSQWPVLHRVREMDPLLIAAFVTPHMLTKLPQVDTNTKVTI